MSLLCCNAGIASLRVRHDGGHRQSGACRAQGYCIALLEGRSAPRLPQRVQVKFGSMSDNLTMSALRSKSRHPTARAEAIFVLLQIPPIP